MATIKIGNISKRVNSTSQSFTGTDLSCRLKNPTSLHDPIFEVQGLTDGAMFNYASYGSHYYWVDDVIQVTNQISEVHCHLDPLATFKSAITNTYGLVTFGDSSHHTEYKDDIRFGPDIKVDRAAGVGIASLNMGFSNSDWTILMTVQNASQSFSYNGVNTFAMTPATYQKVLNGFSGVVYSDISSWSSSDVIDILKNYGIRLLTGGQQALDNIVSCVAVPIPISYFSSIAWATLSTMAMGAYSYTLDGGAVVYYVSPSAVKTGNGVLSLGRPITSSGGNYWLNSPKYCSVKITHPCGYEEINDPSLIKNSSLYAWYSVGVCSGEYQIRITSESSKDSDTIALISGCVAVDMLRLVPNTNVTMDSNLHNSIGNALISGATGGIIQFNPGSNSPASRQGANTHGGYAGIANLTAGKTCFLDTEYYIPAIFSGGDSSEYNNYCNIYGYPVDRYLKLGDISGYCQAQNVSIGSISGATESDKQIINNAINSGIYIE